MINALRVGYSVIRYRGGIGQWAWGVNRVAGLGLLAFLGLHIFDIFLLGFGPKLFEELLFLYKGPVARILEVFLAFGLTYHGINGVRLIVMDFVPATARHHVKMFYIQLIIFFALFVPAGIFMLKEFFDIGGGIIGTLIVLALPLIVAFAANLAPTSGDNVQVSNGNYAAATRETASARGRAPSGSEFWLWLFMRVSGLLLILLAFFHFFVMHFVIGVEKINFAVIVERWTDPAQSAFWRTYDALLLFFAFTHGVNGARMVISDYFHSPGWRAFLKIGLFLFWFVLMGMGMFIILTFNPGMIK
ncbi:MAG: hypothetical protein HY070_07225 [Chloroflexi bacterium]|nr:hypothetical protein [Chloroflexota bacterium]